MAKSKRVDPKLDALRRSGSLNARPQTVIDPVFRSNDFFDARDLVQVKYEMLRRVRVDRRAVSAAASEFGLSRPSFYQAKAAFEREGLPGLVPRKRGPQGAHKLTDQILAFVLAAKADDPSLTASRLVPLIRTQFGLSLHPRTLERGLERHRKKAR
jgi:transposase